jgi:lysophospholipase L1-like esterase
MEADRRVLFRVRPLSAALRRVAQARGVPFVDVFGTLCANGAWTAEAAAGDGAHPGAGGYAALARLVLAGGWLEWLAGVPPFLIPESQQI